MKNAEYRKIFSSLYKPYGYGKLRWYTFPDGSIYEAQPCYYCGEIATGIDHVYPLIATAQLSAIEKKPPQKLLIHVPACLECNVLLGDKVFSALSKRKAFIKKALKKRYIKVLSIPEWSETERQELGYTLQMFVELGSHECERIKKRLEW